MTKISSFSETKNQLSRIEEKGLLTVYRLAKFRKISRTSFYEKFCAPTHYDKEIANDILNSLANSGKIILTRRSIRLVKP